MLERNVEKYFCLRVEETGGIHRKIQFIGRNGCPDRMVGWPNGYTALIEMKRPLTPKAEGHQEREHARLRAHGFRVEVLATMEQIDEFIWRATGQ